MSYCTDARLLVRIPATSSASVDQRALALQDAQSMINAEAYGGRTERAHAFLAAHYLAIAGTVSGGPEGPVASHSAGEISASYAISAGSSDDSQLLTTSYGREFVAIRNTIASRVVFA